MKRLLPILLLAAKAAAALGQAHGNEWIDYGRQYWRFDIWADGVYRIDSATLAQSGFPIGTVDPRHLMLFGKERQVPLYVHGGADGALNAGDFIEFRAEKADGEVDKRMYPYPDADPNPYYSLYNDTVRYYLTWDPAAEPLRAEPYASADHAAHDPAPWGWHTAVQAYSMYYWGGLAQHDLQQYNISSSLSPMLEAEGFGGMPLFVDGAANNIATQDAYVLTPSPYAAADAPDARVVATVASQNNAGNAAYMNHHTQWRYGPGFSIVGADTIYSGSRTMRGAFAMPASHLGPGATVRFHAPHDLMDGALNQIGAIDPQYLDWQAVSSLSVRYARTFAINGSGPVSFSLPSGADPLARIDLTGFAGTPVVYAQGDTLRRVQAVQEGGTWHAVFPRMPGNAETDLTVFAEEDVRHVAALRPVGNGGHFTDFGALDLDSAMLIVTHQSLMGGASAYAAYRQASLRNRYNALVADVDELYDQFGGGVPKHAYAIRAFCRYLLGAWSTQPRALFLIGKSINTWQAFYTPLPAIRPNVGTNYERCLVPTYGYPSSDAAFTTGLLYDARRMDIPVGRLSATTNADVLAYLAKVQATEEQPVALWQKNILHFAGGFTPGEVAYLANDLHHLAAIAADSLMGANVVPFRKQSSSVISQASADSVRHFIEDEGTSLLTFLAHAYSASFDITIDEPQNYDWGGKHPMVMGNSCYIGYIHGNGPPSASEKWVLMPGAGPIAFLAAAEQGFQHLLMSYAIPWYESLSRVNQGGSIGEHMKYAGYTSQLLQPTSLTAWNVQNFALEGDPTLTLNQHRLPDYTVAQDRILIEPANLTADLDSFTVKVIVENQGRAVNRSINVELTRTRADGASTMHYAALENVYLRDTAVFRLPTLGFAGGQGPNQFTVKVDLEPDLVPEIEDVANNQAGTPAFISSGDLIPVWPYAYAITPEAAPTLKACTGDPFAPVRPYVFQIDTTDLFNSPLRQTATIQAPGGVVSWDPPAIFAINAQQDSTVFFWRCSLDSSATGTGQYNWYERSFQHIAGKWGWGQAHYFQFKEDGFVGIRYDRPERDFDFEEGVRTLRANVQGNVPGPSTSWGIELAPVDYGGCGPAAWHVGVVDPSTMEPWYTYWVNPQTGQAYNPDHQFGNYNNNGTCRNRYEGYFAFHTNSPQQLAGLQGMLTTSIPDGHHVIMYTWRHLDKAGTLANGPGVAAALQAAGMPSFAALHDSVPYICYFRKGDPSTFRDTIGAALTDELPFTVQVPTAFARGTITTMDAGPAASWHGLYWDELPAAPTDSTRIKVSGFAPGSSQPVPLLDLHSPLDSVPDLGALIDAHQYPVLRLRGEFHDSNASDARPAQIKRWQLLSTPVPDCAIHPPLGLYNDLEGYAEGQMAGAAVAVQNISAFDMDSLVIEAWVVDPANNRRLVHRRRNPPLPAGAWVMDTVRFSTLGLGGASTLVIEANPIDSATSLHYQPEQHYFNNIAYWRFEVERDIENPILDVTFDGRHILNGDIVSARPEIRISLDDENPIRLLDSPGDTTCFKVFLSLPDGSQQQVRFRDGAGNEVMRFIPANGPENIARIEYRPHFAQDGRYSLTVFASDLAGNRSGDHDYKAAFEVINRPTITEVLNYPNPFTTSTRFVFTVTGQQPPTQMRIQIMTVTGRVVREVGLAELGPIRVGRNITEFAWDGTDEFGDRLARGVYLYRVIARLNGEDIEVRETQASPYFTKGFGKMYLLR